MKFGVNVVYIYYPHFLSPVMFDDLEFAHRAYDPWLSYGQAKTANSIPAAS
jgi:hypothetical protein